MSHILLQKVLEFHQKYKKTIGDPRSPKLTEVDFRLELLDEEHQELLDALALPEGKERIVEVADAIGDMIYVLVGSAISWGIDIASVLDAIHESNMTKTAGLSSDDKCIKGPEYQPPKIAETLEMVAHECDQAVTEDGSWEDSFWPQPSLIPGEGVDFLPKDTDEEPAQEITDRIMLSAKEQAKILAMKSIKTDLLPVKHSEEDHTLGCTERCTPKANKPVFTKTTKGEVLRVMQGPGDKYVIPPQSDGVPEEIKGSITSYGCFVFDCTCGRTHGVQMTLGSRGGLASSGKCECMCGKAFLVDFPKGKDPKVTVTTIEELRKANA